MTDTPTAPTPIQPAHALDTDLHLHIPLTALQAHKATEAGGMVAQIALEQGQGDRARARSVLLRSALEAIIETDLVLALAMLDGLAHVLRTDAVHLLTEATP